MKRSTRHVIAGAMALSLIAAACGSDEAAEPAASEAAPPASEAAETPASEAAAPATEAPPATEAAEEEPPATEAVADGPCPSKMVIQTDWWPELEHGGTYQLIGPGGTANKENFTYSGPIQSQYAAGGVTEVEIRAGGDAIAFAPVTSEMQLKDEITLGYVNLSDAMKDSVTAPVVGVAKTLELNPQMIMWDPTQLEIDKADPTTISASGAKVLYFDGTTYMDFLLSEGVVNSDQLDPSYGGAPDQWIANAGNFVQQGFATNEIYKYENDIAWKDGAAAPVDYLLIDELGFRDYPAMMAVRADKLEGLTDCLTAFVPMMQQAWIDFLAEPKPVTDALIAVNETYDTYWSLSEGLNVKGLEIVEEKGIAANSPDGTYCTIDADRVAGMAALLTPIFEADGVDVADDLSAVATQDFCAGVAGR
jgi:hypothetical protein